MNLREYLESAGYKPVNQSYYERIKLWRQWYKGKVAGFHDYDIFSSGKRIHRSRARLGMAKQGAEYWANLLWNDECSILLANEADDKRIREILEANDFYAQANRLTEYAFALGTGAFVVFESNGETRIDYLPAEFVFPLTWRGSTVESCAMAGIVNVEGQRLLYLMVHEMQPDGRYMVHNRFFTQREGSEDLTPAPTPQGVLERYPARVRRFALVRPNLANNLDNVPLGIAVYANCIDVLKGIDLAYDGTNASMEIGRPRIGVTGNMLRPDPTTSEPMSMFDANDVAVYDMGGPGVTDTVEVKDLTTQYRADKFELSLQAQLNVYSQAIGLGDKAFLWQRESVQTATQVISENSAMLRTMEKHQQGLRGAITDVVRAVLDINGMDSAQEVTIQFDDSVTRDRTAEAAEAWQWVLAGKMAYWRYLVLYKNYSEADAKQYEAEAQQARGPTLEE